MYGIKINNDKIKIPDIIINYHDDNSNILSIDVNDPKVIRSVDYTGSKEELWEGDIVKSFGSGRGKIVWSSDKAAWCVEILEDAGGSIYKGDLILLSDYHNFHKEN